MLLIVQRFLPQSWYIQLEKPTGFVVGVVYQKAIVNRMILSLTDLLVVVQLHWQRITYRAKNLLAMRLDEKYYQIALSTNRSKEIGVSSMKMDKVEACVVKMTNFTHQIMLNYTTC